MKMTAAQLVGPTLASARPGQAPALQALFSCTVVSRRIMESAACAMISRPACPSGQNSLPTRKGVVFRQINAGISMKTKGRLPPAPAQAGMSHKTNDLGLRSGNITENKGGCLLQGCWNLTTRGREAVKQFESVMLIPQSREKHLCSCPYLIEEKTTAEILRCYENDSGTVGRADACVAQAGASPGPTSAIFMHIGEPKDHGVCGVRHDLSPSLSFRSKQPTNSKRGCFLTDQCGNLYENKGSGFDNDRKQECH